MKILMFIIEFDVFICFIDVKKYIEKLCIEYIKKVVINMFIYWFGINYNVVCLKGSVMLFNCINFRVGIVDSIVNCL